MRFTGITVEPDKSREHCNIGAGPHSHSVIASRGGVEMNIPLVDLKAQYDSIREEINYAISKVIERGEFILGSEVKAFEEEIAS